MCHVPCLLVHTVVVDPHVVRASALVERRTMLLEVRAVVPVGGWSVSIVASDKGGGGKTHSGPITVIKMTNAATTSMRISCTFP
jgi:hypothetical protein